MNQDRLGRSIKSLPRRSPSAGFDARLLSRLRAERAWRRAAGFAFGWACAGTAAAALAPAWLGWSAPTAAQAQVWAASRLVDAVRWASWAGQELSSVDAPRAAVQLLAASALALAALSVLAPRPIAVKGSRQ